MKNKKLMKAISIVLIALTIIMAVMPVFADSLPDPKTYEGNQTSGAAIATKDIIELVLGILQVVAVGVAVIMLIVLAIKYISASPEGKADIKKTAVQYVIGAFLLFGSAAILGIVRSAAATIHEYTP
ncbi:MAG: hypothetical protein IJH39_02170 [Clostridia bacterium]|nr:hypothetical protein [Clostridia bacterium]